MEWFRSVPFQWNGSIPVMCLVGDKSWNGMVLLVRLVEEMESVNLSMHRHINYDTMHKLNDNRI